MDSVRASHPAAPGLIPGVPEVFSKKNCLGEINVNVARLIDRTALLLRSVDSRLLA